MDADGGNPGIAFMEYPKLQALNARFQTLNLELKALMAVAKEISKA